jgi:hypothetical protein
MMRVSLGIAAGSRMPLDQGGSFPADTVGVTGIQGRSTQPVVMRGCATASSSPPGRKPVDNGLRRGGWRPRRAKATGVAVTLRASAAIFAALDPPPRCLRGVRSVTAASV